MSRYAPLFDAWRARTEGKLSERGMKAELAAHMAVHYGRTARSWEAYICSILHGRRLPNAEIVMAIDSWIESRSLSKKRTAR